MEVALSIMTTHSIATMDQTSVLIVARAGRIRDGLSFVLKAKPWIKVVGQTDNSDLALAMVSQHRPTLVILDTNISNNGDWVAVLDQVKAVAPKTRCLVLTDPMQKPQAVRAAGSDAVLIKGFPLAKLFTTIEELSSL